MGGAVLSLAVTSSTSVVGVAAGPVVPGADQGPDAVVCHQVVTERRHAEELAPLLARTLSEAGATLEQVDRFVVDVGPGRFTGLRVGLATVKALALATGRPVVALTSLEILAGAEADRPVVAVVDARRAEVFQQVFTAEGPAGPAVVGTPAELAAGVSSMPAVGDGADRYASCYGARLRPGRVPSAATMLALSAGRAGVPGRAVRPVYLRDPDVTVNVKTRPAPT